MCVVQFVFYVDFLPMKPTCVISVDRRLVRQAVATTDAVRVQVIIAMFSYTNPTFPSNVIEVVPMNANAL